MSMFYTDYHEAHAAALGLARGMDHSVGIEACKEHGRYGRKGFRVALIPNDPSERFGWEHRCEPVEPS